MREKIASILSTNASSSVKKRVISVITVLLIAGIAMVSCGGDYTETSNVTGDSPYHELESPSTNQDTSSNVTNTEPATPVTNDICHCGEHYVGEFLRTPTPPLNIREMNEVDDDFLDKFDTIHTVTLREYGDLAEPFIYTTTHVDISDHTIILWPDERLNEISIIALGFEEFAHRSMFYTREIVYNIPELAPTDAIVMNLSVLHYLMPRAGIIFRVGNQLPQRMFFTESMRGGCFPIYGLMVHDETHWARWAGWGGVGRGWEPAIPWEENNGVTTMPVFHNNFRMWPQDFEPRSETELLLVAEDILSRGIFAAMGLTVHDVTTARNSTWGNNITAHAEGVQITVEQSGFIQVLFTEEHVIPAWMDLSWDSPTRNASVEYLTNVFASAMGLPPLAEDAGIVERIVHNSFFGLRFIPDADGRLQSIDTFENICTTSDLIGYFPIISIEEAIERMLAGEGTSFGVDMGQTRPTAECIIAVEVWYFGHSLGRHVVEAFVPWYSFTVLTPDSHHIQSYFVPALRTEYLEANPSWAYYPHQ